MLQVMNTSARRDLWWLLAWALFSAWLCARFDVSEAIASWARPHEGLQLDELPGVLLSVALALCWYACRRYLEARRELSLRLATELRLQDALSDNQRLARRYVENQEQEKKALARDLHDELGQYINAIKLDAVSLRDAAQAQPAVYSSACAMLANIDRVYESIGGLIRQLRPVALDTLGAAAAIEYCVSEWRSRSSTAIEVDIRGDFDDVGDAVSVVMYRLVQEALTNVARHAAAARVRVSIYRDAPDRNVHIHISDDGRGVDLNVRSPGLGLVGMRERVAALGGSVALVSAVQRGFELRAVIPVAGR